jgi:hypothetical protein
MPGQWRHLDRISGCGGCLGVKYPQQAPSDFRIELPVEDQPYCMLRPGRVRIPPMAGSQVTLDGVTTRTRIAGTLVNVRTGRMGGVT